jgi:hypothetical protein
MVTGRARKFTWWPEVFLLVGAALLAYGGSGLLSRSGSDADRFLFTLGAIIALVAFLARRHRPHAP